MRTDRRRMSAPLLLVAALLAAAIPSPALANGDNSHLWITVEAIEHLPDGRLKELLAEPELQEILLNGAIFPDGGYVIGDDYGEMAHWEPFIEAYREWIVRTFEKPYTEGEAAEHAVFLLGIGCHDMADWVFDAQFMEMARVYDAEGWGEGLSDGFDTATDVLLVADTGVALQPESWVPADELSQLYADAFGYTVDAPTLWTGQDMLHRIVLTMPRDTAFNQPEKVAAYREQYPWASANQMDPLVPGSPPSEALAVAAYWQSLWFRLHEESGPDLVVATAPGNGASGHPTDHTLVESQVVIVFGSGMDATTLTTDTVTVRDEEGTPHTIDMALWGGDEGNLLRILPAEDWAADTEYTVTLGPAVTTFTGVGLSEPFSFQFSTAPTTGEPVLPCTDPTPFDGEPDLGESNAGCCSLHGSRKRTPSVPGWLLLALVCAAAVRRR